MAFMAALEADLRALSAEARRRHPSVKDAAEHAILKLRSLSSPMEIAQNEDILRMFLVACSVKSVKLSVIGLSCLQKLISHDAVASSALKDILTTLKDHAEMTDEIVQLKTLQTILIIFQSHLQPESELPLDQSEASPVIKKAPRLLAIIKQLVTAVNMSQAFDICLHLLESNRSSDSVRKSLGRNSVEPTVREKLSNVGKLGLRLLEDLTALAAGGSATWLRVYSLHRTFALDILDMNARISKLAVLMPVLELEGEAGEPAFRRLVLRLVAHVIRLYSSSLVTESEASDLSEETLAAVAGMFSSKAKGIEWSMDNDASNAAVLVASEAHTITLALEGLLGVVFTIATLTDEALDVGEACGVLRAIEPLNSFLASLCKFTINNPNEGEKRSIVLSPGSKKVEMLVDQRDSIILTPKNVQALRTLFNVAHRLHNVLGPSWVLVLETLAALDRAIHSPHASTQEVSASVSRLSRDTSGQYSDFHILSSLNSQPFTGVEPIWDQIAAHHLEWVLKNFRASVQLLIIFKRKKAVTDASEKDLISLGFQSIRVIMNEGLATIPVQCLDECILVTGAYGTQKTDINISLTAVGLLWTATDFVVKGLISKSAEKANGMDEEAESGGTVKEEALSSSEKDIKQSPLKSVVDYNKLFFSVFSVLQKLGADDRPEVRNSAVRTLFQTLSTHGQKLSKTMWEDCLWIYVFPMLERVSHLASTSSRDEWQGKELGTRAGKAVHMLIHHSRNTAQKQWDETIVLVLGGIARLLRSFFPFLQQLSKFSSGWVLLLDFVKNGILNGSKEVALAAINCLQTFVGSNCSKGNLESSYVKSVLDIYELVLQTSPNYKNDSADKVKQEVLRGLGDLYVQAQSLFNDEMYLRLMAVMHLMIKSSMNPTDYDNELGSIPALQRGILEIIPMLRPTTMLSSMWSPLLLELLCYLNSHDTPLQKQGKEMHEQKSDAANGATHGFLERSHLNNSSTKMDNAVGCGWGIMFIEKLVPIVVNLFLEAPQNERFNSSPEVIRCLGRCMNTRRDNPKGTLWRVSAECFNRVLVDEVTHDSADCKSGMSSYKFSRARFWKEVADVYETFLVGSCGRVLSSDVPSVDSVTADETLEMAVLTVFGDNVLKLQKDAPVELYIGDKLMCYSIRNQQREGPLPSVRIDETICVLQELARLIINMETANALSMPLYLKEALEKNESHGRAHLLALLPTFSELVVSSPYQLIEFASSAQSPAVKPRQCRKGANRAGKARIPSPPPFLLIPSQLSSSSSSSSSSS
ncbi:Os01g0772700 [Oryza sativa Japonica Group]|uniref:Os01g0772700 protein n=1 Tax=Oryza sativa subsp. japonica TaxID=39947 RepID=Q0JIX0_ORYSJ|nr:Os01g0772700 [Oryza sativa Japonica Group]|eukprot:NP_001044394.2 Os01g0772700 [Oryza sativa Japonica Group]